MDDSNNSDAARDSDIDIILDDDQSESGDNADHTGYNRRGSEESGGGGSSNKRSDREKRANQADDEPGHPYLPRLKTSIIQMVLSINSELIRLCQEYQNKSLMDDPHLIMYQMRLQSNLAYLASVADNFLDPTRSMPDLSPLP
ncbi:hypothetical protein GGI09_007469, partial [Coemansia sp. S100]